jgi:molecular chaperone GrpE
VTTPSDEVNEESEGVKVTDKRKIDPETGEVREPATAPADAEAVAEVEIEAEEAAIDDQINELTNDLQRLTAEYSNYRKRVDRDRQAVGELAVGAVLSEMLPLLDDIERAREHDELSGAFKSVGEGLEALATKLGLETFGAEGDAFDPMEHEALTHTEASEDADPRAVDGPIVGQVFTPGYRYKGRVVRPARVGVVE